MTSQEILRVVATAGLVGSAAPVLCGAINFKRRELALRLLWCWLALGLCLNLIMAFGGRRGSENGLAAQVGYLTLGIAGLVCLAHFAPSKAVRRLIFAGAMLYVPVWAWRYSAGELFEPFSQVSGPVLWILFTIAASAVIGSRLSIQVVNPRRDPGVVTGLGFIVSYAPSAALEPVSRELFAANPELTRWLYTARGVFLLAGLILFTLVFLWTPHSPRSSGS